jgi:hypothetical protein
MPGALLVRLRAGLRKKKRKKLRRSNEARKNTSKRQKGKGIGSLPAGYQHLAAVALRAVGLAAATFLGALGRGSFAGPSLRRRSLVLASPRGQVVQEFLANFRLQRSRALHDLGVGVG